MSLYNTVFMLPMTISKKERGEILSSLGLAQSLTFDDVQLVPKFSTVESRSNVVTTSRFTKSFMIDKPLIAAPMDSVCEVEMAKELWNAGCVGVIHRFMSIEDQEQQVRSIKSYIDSSAVHPRGYRDITPVICAAIGASGDSFERAQRLMLAGANVLIIDVAHGHHENVRRILEQLINYRIKNSLVVDFVAGNIATSEAAYDLEKWGADALRVGIGGGSVCETRIRTGVGVPQLSAVDIVTAVSEIPIISDGGIRFPGDIAKALAVGANTVMIGSLFAGTDEAPGDVFISGQWPNNKSFKMYRGSASATIKMEKNGSTNHVEGAAKMVECKGPVINIVNDLMDGITSAMSYLGANSVEDMWQHADFVHISNAGLREAHPHLLI